MCYWFGERWYCNGAMHAKVLPVLALHNDPRYHCCSPYSCFSERSFMSQIFSTTFFLSGFFFLHKKFFSLAVFARRRKIFTHLEKSFLFDYFFFCINRFGFFTTTLSIHVHAPISHFSVDLVRGTIKNEWTATAIIRRMANFAWLRPDQTAV